MPAPQPLRILRTTHPSLRSANDAIREEIKRCAVDADAHWRWGAEFESHMLTSLLKNHHPDFMALGLDPRIFKAEPPMPDQPRSSYQLWAKVPGSPKGWVTFGIRKAIYPSSQSLYKQFSDAMRWATLEWVEGERNQPCAYCGLENVPIEIHHESPDFRTLFGDLWMKTVLDKEFQALLQWSRLIAFWAGEVRWNPFTDGLGSHPLLQRFKTLHDSGLRLPLCHSCHIVANALQRDRLGERRTGSQSASV